jgi:gliding motility-associated protein GldM
MNSRNSLQHFREKVDSILDIHKLSAPISLDVEGPFYRQEFEISWQQLMFDRVISVAVATNLSRLITEIRNAEFDVISQLYSAITADDFKFDRIEARIVPNSQIIMQGENYEADIFVAAVDTRQTPQVFVGGQQVQTVDGIGKLRVRTSAEGQQTIRGVIRVTSPTGYPQEYPFSSTYIVQKPTATVSADRMNLFYAGIDNPISFSAPGVTSENLRPSVSAGAQLLRLDNGQWIVRVQPSTSQVKVGINAAMPDGTTKNMGESTFRVRLVPDPMAYIGDRNEGRVTKQQLVGAGAVSAEMKDFEFDLNYRIKSFTMLTTRAGFIVTYNATSNAFTNEMRQAINDATRDQRIFFTNIVTLPGPDGIERTLRDISFVIH